MNLSERPNTLNAEGPNHIGNEEEVNNTALENMREGINLESTKSMEKEGEKAAEHACERSEILKGCWAVYKKKSKQLLISFLKVTL